MSADDDAAWSFLGSAKAASDRAAKLGHQNDVGVGRSHPQDNAGGGGGGGLLGALLSIFAILLWEAIKITGHIMLWTLDMIFTRGRGGRRR
ncbi:MAG: hypothetical protein EOP94_02340 [Zymomonas sp.]|nr:MAG: hypothetical protein EOP94_02340 [Zymomonas sp.]